MIGFAISKNKVKIRLEQERWFHIVENHDYMSGLSNEVLDTIENPEMLIKGSKDDLIAVKEFKQVLASEGLGEIAADGQFDPSLHEAVDTREGDDNMILEVVRKGYNLNNKVLRPAGVVVGRKVQENG